MKKNPESMPVAVVMRRRATVGAAARWQAWRWELADVVPDHDGFGDRARKLFETEHEQRWLHPGYHVELFTDDAEGYYLNVTTAAPCWFVMWRMEADRCDATEQFARPQAVSLSYHDAGRWLDAQETVEQVAAPLPVVEWVRAFTDQHHVIESKRRQRPQSFRTLQDRFGNPASVSTDRKMPTRSS